MNNLDLGPWFPAEVRIADRLADIMLAADDVQEIIDEAPIRTDILESTDDLMQRIWDETNDLMKRLSD